MATFTVTLRRQCMQTVEVTVDVDPPPGVDGLMYNWAREAVIAATEHVDWDLAETEEVDEECVECVSIA